MDNKMNDLEENNIKKSKTNKKKIIAICIVIALLIFIGAAFAYVMTYYRAEDEVLNKFNSDNLASYELEENIYIEMDKDKIMFIPENTSTGIIFYPGGKVQKEAYIPLCYEIAKKGYACIILQVPCNLAILDKNVADGIIDEINNMEGANKIADWYLMGHSLGGVVAGMYLENHMDEYEGIILLASYTTTDYSNSDEKVLSIYGSEDKVLSLEKYEENKYKMGDLTEIVIDGGCHSYFGQYGMQKGDGNPTITREKQFSLTAQYIDEFIKEN